MNQITQSACQAGMMIALAGTTITAAHAQSASTRDATADDAVVIGGNESGDRAGGTLPEIIAGPFQRNDKAYYLLEPSTWELSEQAANQRLGAHLVTINDAVESFFVQDDVLAFDGNGRNGWIGFTDRDSEGNFVWSSNEPVTFTLWFPGDPDGGTAENYTGLLAGNIFWEDLSDSAPSMYGVVEVSVPGVEAGPFYYNGHTYYLLNESNRHEADTAARLLGGHLVTLDDQEEQDWVRSDVLGFDGTGRRAWTGLSDENFEGIYAWDNDSLSTYRNWSANEPNGGGAENYVVVGGGGGWFDAAFDWSPGGAVVHGVVEIGSPNPCLPDVNNDGQLNFFDVAAFISAFNDGCP